MRNLSKKIKDLRLSLGMRQMDFAKAVGGVDQSTVSKWEIGAQKPSSEQTAKIAGLANISVEQLLGLQVPGKSEQQSMRTVLVTGELQAGSWSEATDWPHDDQYSVPAPLPEWTEGMPIHAREVRGSSMNRIYPDGTIVYVAPLPALGRKPRTGESVAVQRVDAAGNYESTLKEYVVDDDGKAWLWPRSTDPLHQAPLEYAARKRGGDVTIVGVVVAYLVMAPR